MVVSSFFIDEKILRDFNETSENIQAVEDYLDEHKEILEGLRGESPRNFNSPMGGNPHKEITANDVAEWIDKKPKTINNILHYFLCRGIKPL
jgi:hypothetical protein